MTVGYRSAISIVELVVYIPALFTAAYISHRHGFGRNAGWIFLIVFSLIRIVGSCCQIEVASKPTKNLLIATSIISSIGLSLLLLATLGLISRALDRLNTQAQVLTRRINLRPIQLVTLAGFILCIIGGVNAASSDNIAKVQNSTKVGISLYLASFAAICLIALYVGTKSKQVEKGETRLVLAVIFSLPFLLVRLIYSSLATFAHNPRFNIMTGSVTIFLVMAVLEEFVIILTFLTAGLSLEVIPKDERPPSYDALIHDGRVPASGSNHITRGGLVGLLIRTLRGHRGQTNYQAEDQELSKLGGRY